MKTLLDAFLHVYFFHIEDLLNTEDNNLKNIKFQSEEANTDEDLKIFFKNFLLSNNKLPKFYFDEVVIVSSGQSSVFQLSALEDFKINEVFLPSELSQEQKNNIAQRKRGVYTNPDLYLEITSESITDHICVELKSTKNDMIPGSSVQQVSPYEWVVFVQRKESKIDIVTGLYINTITERLPFPDRSPRPQIGFKNLKNWNNTYRVIEDNRLVFNYNSDLQEIKNKVLTNWKQVLVDEWLETIKSSKTRTTEKWFNYTIRLYTLQLMEYFEEIGGDKTHELKTQLRDLIEKEKQ